jgi:hypothetical protein
MTTGGHGATIRSTDPGGHPVTEQPTPTPNVLALEDIVARLDALEAENRSLRAALDASQATHAPPTPPTPTADAAADRTDGPSLSRRRLLLGGAAAAAGTAAAMVATEPAAANGHLESFTLGDPSNTASASTGVTAGLGTTPTLAATSTSAPGVAIRGRTNATAGLTVFGAGVFGDSDLYPGVLGHSSSAGGVSGVTGSYPTTIPEAAGVVGASAKQPGVIGASDSSPGVRGFASIGPGVRGESTNGSGVVGSLGASGFTGRAGTIGEAASSYGVAGFSNTRSGVRAASNKAEGIYATSTTNVGGRFGGSRAAINLIPRTTAGRPTSGSHGRGDLVVDRNGALYLCTASGTPGTWVKVSTTPA